MEREDGWRRDPFRRHEARYFVGGRPTARVRDWDVETEDPPPVFNEALPAPAPTMVGPAAAVAPPAPTEAETVAPSPVEVVAPSIEAEPSAPISAEGPPVPAAVAPPAPVVAEPVRSFTPSPAVPQTVGEPVLPGSAPSFSEHFLRPAPVARQTTPVVAPPAPVPPPPPEVIPFTPLTVQPAPTAPPVLTDFVEPEAEPPDVFPPPPAAIVAPPVPVHDDESEFTDIDIPSFVLAPTPPPELVETSVEDAPVVENAPVIEDVELLDSLIESPAPAPSRPDEPRPRSPGTVWRWVGAAVAVPVALGIVYAAFHAKPSPSTASNSTATSLVGGTAGHSTTTVPPTTTTVPPTTTTAPAVPAAPQSTAENAALALINAWSKGDQATALRVATTTAVNTLFATQFHSGMAIDRGCNTVSPTTCAFGPPGGASPADPLYQLTVTAAPGGGFYVSAVLVLGQG